MSLYVIMHILGRTRANNVNKNSYGGQSEKNSLQIIQLYPSYCFTITTSFHVKINCMIKTIRH